MCDSIKSATMKRDALDTASEISKLLKFSPRRNARFEALKGEISPDATGFRILCPTCWTVRAKTLQSIEDNYAVLEELWEEVLSGNVDLDVRARTVGVQAQMRTFNFFFGTSLARLVLSHEDNLSTSLQS